MRTRGKLNDVGAKPSATKIVKLGKDEQLDSIPVVQAEVGARVPERGPVLRENPSDLHRGLCTTEDETGSFLASNGWLWQFVNAIKSGNSPAAENLIPEFEPSLRTLL